MLMHRFEEASFARSDSMDLVMLLLRYPKPLGTQLTNPLQQRNKLILLDLKSGGSGKGKLQTLRCIYVGLAQQDYC